MPVFEQRCLLPATMDRVIAFHEDPRALKMLTPPPVFIQVHRRDWRSATEARLEMTMWFGPLPLRWVAQHEPGPIPASFVDRMVEGPMASWVHEHRFLQGDHGVELLDRVSYEHRPGAILTRILFNPLALRTLFGYRHWVTRRSLLPLSPGP